MCVGFWSLEHPDYALYVLTTFDSVNAVLPFSIAKKLASCAVTGMSICRAQPHQPIFTHSRSSANQRTSELEPYFRVAIFVLEGHGLVSIAREGLQFCTHASGVSNGLECKKKLKGTHTGLTSQRKLVNTVRQEGNSSLLFCSRIPRA